MTIARTHLLQVGDEVGELVEVEFAVGVLVVRTEGLGAVVVRRVEAVQRQRLPDLAKIDKPRAVPIDPGENILEALTDAPLMRPHGGSSVLLPGQIGDGIIVDRGVVAVGRYVGLLAAGMAQIAVDLMEAIRRVRSVQS